MTDRPPITDLASIRLARRVEVFGTPTCQYTRGLVAYLVERGVSFMFLGVHGDPDTAVRMIEISGQMGVPVLHANGKVVIGFRKKLIDEALGDLAVPSPELAMDVADLFSESPPPDEAGFDFDDELEQLLAEMSAADDEDAVADTKLRLVEAATDDEDDEST